MQLLLLRPPSIVDSPPHPAEHPQLRFQCLGAERFEKHPGLIVQNTTAVT